MNLLNLTPHPIVIRVGGDEIVIPPSGQVARVIVKMDTAGTLDCNGIAIPLVSRTIGEVVGLPTDGTPCIVSSMVLEQCKGMHNVFAPDTGSTAVRDENGHIVAVTQLVAAGL